MTQQNNTTNWLIQGSNGAPQVIKLVQSTGKPLSGIMTSTVAGQPVKIFKSPTNTQESAQAFSGTQVLRTIGSTSKIVSKVPVGNVSKLTRAIRLTPAQMQNFKLVNSTNPKLQSNTSPIPVTVITPNAKKNSLSILSRKRQDPLEIDCNRDMDIDFTIESKRGRKSDKVGKGLRHFSNKVCEKVKQKGVTTYNEVADELVGEFTNASSNNSLADQYDQKNIRRRVYDALNVLMAMNIILKEKKEIKWIGLPTNSLQECHQLQIEIKKKERSIREKQNQLNELILNQIAFKNLAQRNKEAERNHGPPPSTAYIQLPFIVVNTNKKTVINCSISNDKMEYQFQFSDKFEINDDVDILKSIGMLKGLDKGECSPADLENIKALVPESLWPYVDNIASGKANSFPGTSTSSAVNADEFVETTMDEDNSHQSSAFDPLSPSAQEFSDDENDSEMSSDLELN